MRRQRQKNAPVSVVIDKNTQTVDDNSNSLEHETVYPAASDNKIAAKAVESEPSREAENDESAFTFNFRAAALGSTI